MGQSQNGRGGRACPGGVGGADCEGGLDRGPDELGRHRLGEEVSRDAVRGAEEGGARCKAAAREPAFQEVASAGHAAADGSDRTIQRGGGLVVSLPSQIAQHQRSTILRRQVAQFLIEHWSDSEHVAALGRGDEFRIPDGLFATAAAEQVCPCPRGDAKRDTVEPVRQQTAVADSGRLSQEDEKGCLESVFDIARVAEEAAAEAQDHGPVHLDQRLEGRMITTGEKAFEQLAVTQGCQGSLAPESVELLQHGSSFDTGHFFNSSCFECSITQVTASYARTNPREMEEKFEELGFVAEMLRDDCLPRPEGASTLSGSMTFVGEVRDDWIREEKRGLRDARA